MHWNWRKNKKSIKIDFEMKDSCDYTEPMTEIILAGFFFFHFYFFCLRMLSALPEVDTNRMKY